MKVHKEIIQAEFQIDTLYSSHCQNKTNQT